MFQKRENMKNCHSVIEVVEQNTGMPIHEFLKVEENHIIHNLEKVAESIIALKKNSGSNVPLTIVGDYDSDGVNSTVILKQTLEKMGFTNISVRIPRRFSEGYGISPKIIDEISEGVIITIDNGIAALDAIKKAKEKGLKVLIIDHHLPVMVNEQIVLPEADIIVDPAAEALSTFHHYCGAALAYELSKLLLGKSVPEFAIMASIATVTDVMPLIGPNRALVIEGLKLINQKIEGPLQVLKEKLGLKYQITTYDYGFRIGPVFNAAERLYDGGAMEVVKFLDGKMSSEQLSVLAEKLIAVNEQRKEAVNSGQEYAENIYEADKSLPIVLTVPNVSEGIIGIIAGNLTEKYNAPAIVFTPSKKNPALLKGSGRSVEELHLKEILDAISENLDHYGGHAGAAGLAVKTEQFNSFKNAFEKEVCNRANLVNFEMGEKDVHYYDIDLNKDLKNNIELIRKAIKDLKKCEPYGEQNPKPVFYMKARVDAQKIKYMGKNKEHFKIQGNSFSLVGFNKAEEYHEMGDPEYIECTGTLDTNEYNGTISYQFVIYSFKAL